MLCCPPSDVSLQRKVLLLLEHLSHSDNLDMTCCLAERACNTLLQQQELCACPLPLSGSSSSSGRQMLWQQQQPGQTLELTDNGPSDMAKVAAGSSSNNRHPITAAQQRLRSACHVVWHPNMFLRPANSAGVSSSCSSKMCSNTATADAAAGLAGSTLRLLKLLSLPVLDTNSLTVGGMINKGAFSEVFSGTVSWEPREGGGQPNTRGQGPCGCVSVCVR